MGKLQGSEDTIFPEKKIQDRWKENDQMSIL